MAIDIVADISDPVIGWGIDLIIVDSTVLALSAIPTIGLLWDASRASPASCLARARMVAFPAWSFLTHLALPKSIKDWSLKTMREKLVKIEAKVVSHACQVTFQMAKLLVSRSLFYELLGRIHCLTPIPVATG